VDSTSLREQVPLRRIVLWTIVALAVVLGLVLYFIYEPRVATFVV
jgi:type VI protein secretion system component VasF